MAVTHGHGNPSWTRDEVILALDLYFDLKGEIPASSDPRIQELSLLLRTFPHHSQAARKESFRNAAGVAFKLQNLRKVATGKGLGNVSRTDREVWTDYGSNPTRTKEIANLIKAGIQVVEGVEQGLSDYEVFIEGKVVTETHLRRERDPKLRKRLTEQRRKSGGLKCDICGCTPLSPVASFGEAMFEAHHVLPLAASLERETKLKDMALLCANCHRMIHKAISVEKRWLTIDEAKKIILGG